MCLCLASQKPSEREFFLPPGTHLGVKLFKKTLSCKVQDQTDVFPQLAKSNKGSGKKTLPAQVIPHDSDLDVAFEQILTLLWLIEESLRG